MKILLRLTSLLTAVLALATHLHFRRRLIYLDYGKMIITALSPFLALGGGLLTLLGLWRRDGLAAVFSAGAAFLAGRYIVKVAAPHDGFRRAFGPDWEARIPETIRPNLSLERYIFPPPPVPRLACARDVTIQLETGGLPLLADIWQPPDNIALTGLAVIYLHGSAWHYLDKDMGTRPLFCHLAGQGHVVLDLAYTLAPRADLYGMVGDVKRAIAWIKQHAGDYGVNPERIVLMGGSAGGHLALLSAYTPNHPALQPAGMTDDTSVRGVVSYYGITDLAAAHGYLQTMPPLPFGVERLEALLRRGRFLPPYGKLVQGADVIAHWLGGSPTEAAPLYRFASPISHIGPHCPPTLLINGAHDFCLEVTQHGRLHEALCAAGVPAVHVELPYTDHAFDLFFWRWAPAAQSAIYDTDRFLALLI